MCSKYAKMKVFTKGERQVNTSCVRFLHICELIYSKWKDNSLYRQQAHSGCDAILSAAMWKEDIHHTCMHHYSAHIHTCTHACIHTCTHACIYTCTHACIHHCSAHIYTCTHNTTDRPTDACLQLNGPS